MGLPETMIGVRCLNSSQEAHHKDRRLQLTALTFPDENFPSEPTA